MKKSELKAAVKAAVAAKGIELDKNVLAVELMQQGASLSMVNRELNSALKANGVVIVTNTGSEELKAVRTAINAALTAESPKVIATYKDLREYAEDLEDEFAITETASIKAIKSELKALKLEIPNKVKLGVQKEAILNYFLETKQKDQSLEGLKKYLQANVMTRTKKVWIPKKRYILHA